MYNLAARTYGYSIGKDNKTVATLITADEVALMALNLSIGADTYGRGTAAYEEYVQRLCATYDQEEVAS